MKSRIRAAALIVQDEKILMVKHVHPTTQDVRWVPPGGGMESYDMSIIDCVMREVQEETGFDVEVDHDPHFIREFFDTEHETLNMEFFFTARIIGGNLSMAFIAGKGDDEQYIKDVRWCTISDLQECVIYPEILKKNFGRDNKNVFLGRQN